MSTLAAAARRASGLSQAEVARRAGTSRPNVSAYERGRRSPTLETLERLLAANDQRLTTVPILHFRQHLDRLGKPFFVPNQFPQLPPPASLAQVRLALQVHWSSAQQVWDLSDRTQRMLAYQLLLAEGEPSDISSYVDGTLLVDLWADLYLPADIRAAWQPLVDQALGRGSATTSHIDPQTPPSSFRK